MPNASTVHHMEEDVPELVCERAPVHPRVFSSIFRRSPPTHQNPSRTAGMGHRQVMEMEELMNAGWLSHGVWLDRPQMKECVKLGCI